MVIDYAAAHVGIVRQVVLALIDAATQKPNRDPVRLLLLERSSSQWWDEFIGADSRSAELKNIVLNTEPMELVQLSAEDLRSLVLDTAKGKPLDVEFALTAISRLDPQCRPLFAQMVVDAIIETELAVGSSLKDVLEHVLQREEKHFWQAVDQKHRTLIAVATAFHGIGLSILEKPEADDELPGLSAFDAGCYENAVASKLRTNAAEDDDILPPLEPDMLGEYFVIRYLTSGPTRQSTARLEWFKSLLWSQKPDDCARLAAFIARLVQDFPEDDLAKLLVQHRAPIDERAFPWADAVAAVLQGRIFGQHDERLRILCESVIDISYALANSECELGRLWRALYFINRFYLRNVDPNGSLAVCRAITAICDVESDDVSINGVLVAALSETAALTIMVDQRPTRAVAIARKAVNLALRRPVSSFGITMCLDVGGQAVEWLAETQPDRAGTLWAKLLQLAKNSLDIAKACWPARAIITQLALAGRFADALAIWGDVSKYLGQWIPAANDYGNVYQAVGARFVLLLSERASDDEFKQYAHVADEVDQGVAFIGAVVRGSYNEGQPDELVAGLATAFLRMERLTDAHRWTDVALSVFEHYGDHDHTRSVDFLAYYGSAAIRFNLVAETAYASDRLRDILADTAKLTAEAQASLIVAALQRTEHLMNSDSGIHASALLAPLIPLIEREQVNDAFAMMIDAESRSSVVGLLRSVPEPSFHMLADTVERAASRSSSSFR